MAAPMRDGAQDASGQRPRADGRAAPRTEQPNNFEYDDNEWDIGIGDLIIDLDADIEKTDEGTAAGAMASAAGGPAKAAAAKLADHSATLDKGLKMKIKRTKPGTKTSEAKHEIVSNGGAATEPPPPASEGAPPAPGAPPARRASAAHRRDKAREKHPAAELNGAPPAAEPLAAPAAPAAAAPAAAEPPRVRPASPPAAQSAEPPPPKKLKTDSKECADVCVGTSVGTITEPDCLGPCEPGTSVTLEGIVWHETEGGVLVVNVTWRGKTYVGTLLDCTRHDWAPPRFCDSPTEELDARTPKGRAKRGRGAAPGGDLSNFTETRSSVHSKLRNGGAKGRRGGAAGAGAATPAREAPSPPPPTRASPSPAPSPAPPAPPGKRKARGPEEDSPAGKRRAPSSPPASPALLECPEPNCSKKYKHINGLKYHQSHAHGAIDEDESKDVASMSENDESNAEAPSPAGPVKSPDKPQDPGTPKKEDRQEVLTPVTPAVTPVPPAPVPAEPPAPPVAAPSVAPPPSPAAAAAATAVVVVAAEVKPPPVKPGVLRFGPQEDFPVANFVNKLPPASPVTVAPVPGNPAPVAVRPPESVPRQFSVLSQGLQQPPPVQGAPPHHGGHPPHPVVLPVPNHVQHPAQQNSQMESALPQNIGPPNQQKGPPPSQQNSQFKVKPTAALMPAEEKKIPDGVANKPQGFKKNSKSRKSPGGSPHPPERPAFGMEQTGREEVQSPAYSDISDDNAPVMENEVDKSKILGEKKPDGGPPLPHSIPAGYGMYQFFGQTPYLVPSVQNQSMTDPNKIKEDLNKQPDGKTLSEKDIKRESPPENMAPQKMLQHYYPYGYMPPGYPYNMDPNYGPVSMVPEDKLKEQHERDRERSKESPSPAEHNSGKPPPVPSQQQGMMGGSKPKQPDMMKDKHPNENHQILKESIEMKSQMNPYLYQRHQQHQAQQAQHHQREEEMRRYYMSLEQRQRKENSLGPDGGKQQQQLQQQQGQNKPPQGPPKPPSAKEGKPEDSKGQGKEDMKPIKQEGQKPTMETTGPPPPPTSQYYLHPSYMQPPHYGGLPFDPMYRGLNPMLVSGPYGPGPYLHPGPMPRYHAPEDLSRPPPPAKALDLLQHHASQYYSSHKIHELQERALKSPTPKTAGTGGSPGVSAPGQPPSGAPPPAPPKRGATPPTAGPETAPGKESRSPPPQRHVHTHHHTHVGLGYPLYPAPYGAAAVLASQRAAAVSVVNSFPPK